MKTKLSNINNFSSPHDSSHDSARDSRIDTALRAYAHSFPRPGLESRVVARLASAPHLSRFQRLRLFTSAHRAAWQRLSIGVLGTAAACAIVVGTVQHSRHTPPPQAAGAARQGGVSTANGVHVPTHAMPAAAQIDPAAPRPPTHGRARVSPNQRRRDAGAAYPRSPYPPDAQPESSANQQQ